MFCRGKAPPHLTEKGEHNLKYLTALKHNNRQRRGFTLAETLIAVGILVVLMALLIPNLIQMQKSLRQKELDAKAEIIYVAAQNELAKLRSGGNAGKFTALLRGGDDDGVRMLSSNGSLSTANDWLSVATEDLLHPGHHWVVIYNANTASVVEVFYSENTDFENEYEDYRGPEGAPLTETNRFKKGANVGYYNGAMTGGSSTPVPRIILHPNISIDNGEKLIVTLSCSVPDTVDGRNLQFSFTMRDTSGGEYSEEFSGSELSTVDNKVQVSLTLDDLSSGATRFSNLYGTYLTPGDNLTLDLTVTDTTNSSASGSAPQRTTNSLFENVKEAGGARTAEIKWGRHLQNLDNSSGVTSQITAAELIQTIDFGNGNSSGNKWLECYKRTYFNGKQQGLPKFKPIKNDNLGHFYAASAGSESTKAKVAIQRLNIGYTRGAAAAGLFERFGGNNSKLENINLESPFVLSSGSPAGALVGFVDGKCDIINCGVYLASDDYNGAHKKPQSYNWISGSNVGGLIGMLSAKPQHGPDGAEIQKELSIQNSFAATTLYGNNVGGLVGDVAEGKLSIRNSYADCYVTGREAGGLVGFGPVNIISNSYAAGFLKSPVQSIGDAAGFVNGTVGTLENSYTVCDLKSKNKIAAANAVTAASNTYYLRSSTDLALDLPNILPINDSVRNDMANIMNNAAGTVIFRRGAGTNPIATPYNLDNLGRQKASYEYPSLIGIQHYGDWLAELRVGSLVYYEAYAGNIYGFEGGNIARTLHDDLPLVGDGYGVLSDQPLPVINVSIDGGDTVPLNPGVYYTVFTDKNQYYIYPLTPEMLNAPPAKAGAEGFWRTATVTTSYGTLSFDFNPLLAGMPEISTGEALSYPEETLVRSARQLNALSKYYTLYWADWAPNCLQELNIDYANYQWAKYYNVDQIYPITQQEPIGFPFRGVYDGGSHRIANVSFVSNYGSNVGLFGSTVSIIKNVVVAVDYNPNALWRVERTASIGTNQTVNMGVLVGQNYGYISNCAVAGYCLTGADHLSISTYSDATLHAGGLVGRNNGTIENCSAVIPNLRLSATYSTEVSIGGLVGLNNGAVRNCYCLANLSAEGRASTVNMSGFAGSNAGGQINGSYCATSKIASGTVDAFCFASDGGVLRDNYYLSEGTYSLADVLRSYEGGIEVQGCKAMTYAEMASRRWLSPVDKEHSRNHNHTQTIDENNFYPFRGTVTADGVYVHYGDWQVEPVLGEIGVFYWEKEAGGSNDGYHISFLGTRHDGDTNKPTSASTLCTAHDDGGAIVEYGYGYYYDSSFTNVDFADSNLDGTNGIVARRSGAGGTPAQLAKLELEKQINGYTFVPFLTQYSENSDADCLYLTQGSNSVETKPITYGTWTLKYDHDGDGTVDEYSYTISPFFGNAMSRVAGKPLAEGTNKKEWVLPGNKLADSEDIRNPYEVRSVQQLRYINWSVGNKNCTTLVTKENLKQFPFLQYATQTGSYAMKRTDAEANRKYQFWLQTHDVLGMEPGEDGKLVPVKDYTPIAGKATSSPKGGHDNPLYAWFGGSYNGQSYKIQKLEIISNSYTVGLFGVTVGAEIQNIIMYGDGSTVVERNTAPEYGEVGDHVGAYQLGGLIGLAYDYNINSLTDATASTISNCAIAGYHIVDNSRNQHGLGYASIGGLFGISNTKLQGCSAVVDFDINYRSPQGANAADVYSDYGNMLRIGGITGTGLFRITDCYSGGHVKIDEETLYEKPWGYQEGATGDQWLDREKSVVIFVGGIAGSSYKNNIKNFTNDSGKATDGSVTLTNCYTYLELPPMKGNVRSSSIFVGSGDRAGQATKLYANNCYFLESSVLGGLSMDAWCTTNYEHPDYKLKNGGKKLDNQTLTPAEVEETLYGNMDRVGQLVLGHSLNGGRANPSKDHQTPVSYNRLNSGFQTDGGMKESLAGTWGWVTVTEQSGNNVSGKFSFSPDPSQAGMDYPFPAVVRQVDGDDDDTNNPFVHYGAWPWPNENPHWELGRGTMDIFTDMQATDYAEKTFKLENKTLNAALNGFSGTAFYTCARSGADDLVFEISPAGMAELVKVEPADGELNLTLTPLAAGSVTVKLNIGGQTSATQVFTFGADLAEQTQSFTLANHGLDESATWEGSEVWTSGAQSFRIAPCNRASVIRAEPKQNADTGENYVDVTLRARDTGSVTLTDVNSGAYCNVSISALLNVTAKDTNEDELKQISVAESDVVFTAHAVCNAAESGASPAGREFTDSRHGAWSFEPADMKNVAREGNRFTVVKDLSSIGDDSVTLMFTYDYWGIPLVSTKALPIRTLGYIGLSDGSSYVRRQRLDDEIGDQTGPRQNPSNLRQPQGTDIFLFAPAGDGDLAQFVLTNVAVTDANTNEPLNTTQVQVKYFEQDGHPMVTQDPLDENTEYNYLGFTVRGLTEQRVVNITLTLTDPRNGKPVELSIGNIRACRYVVHYNSNATNATGTMLDTGIFTVDDGEQGNTLAPCGFTRTGYICTGWNTAADGSGNPYELDQEIRTADADLTLYAQWKPITYIVRFEPNNWLDDDAVSCVFTYDETSLPQDPTDETDTTTYVNAEFDPEAPESPLDNPSRVGVRFTLPEWAAGFDSWNTAVDGSETQYVYTGENIMNLTAVQGEEITLYAQWKNRITLLLEDTENQSAQTFTMTSGMTSLPDTYQQPTPPQPGLKLSGWFDSSAANATLVLNEKGEIVNNCPGITEGGKFVMEIDTTLYAHWNKDRTLTLKTGNNDYSETIVTAGVPFAVLPKYSKPDDINGWTLDGWFTAQNASGLKLLNADGSVYSGASSGEGFTVETSDGTKKLMLIDDLTLYSRWTRTGYVQIEQLSGGENANSKNYLIASGNTGDVKLLTDDTTSGSQSSITFSSTAAKVNNTPFIDSDGNEQSKAWIILDGDSLEDEAAYKWEFKYYSDADIENGTDVDRSWYGFKNDDGTVSQYDRYMILNKNGLSIQDRGPNFQMRGSTGDDNHSWFWKKLVNARNLWTYGVARKHAREIQPTEHDEVLEYTLISEYSDSEYLNNTTPWIIHQDQGGIGYKNNKWTIEQNNQCYLFLGQTIYTYNP